MGAASHLTGTYTSHLLFSAIRVEVSVERVRYLKSIAPGARLSLKSFLQLLDIIEQV